MGGAQGRVSSQVYRFMFFLRGMAWVTEFGKIIRPLGSAEKAGRAVLSFQEGDMLGDMKRSRLVRNKDKESARSKEPEWNLILGISSL